MPGKTTGGMIITEIRWLSETQGLPILLAEQLTSAALCLLYPDSCTECMEDSCAFDHHKRDLDN